MDNIIGFFTGIMAVFGFGDPDIHNYTGYVEGDYIYVSPTSSGRLDEITVVAADWVEEGTVLFVQDRAQAQAAVVIARSHIGIAQAQYENTLSGARVEEIEVVEAQLEMALANLLLAEQAAARNTDLVNNGVVSQTRLDTDLAQLAATQAQVHQLRAQISAMSLPARPAEREKAAANLTAAKAELARAQTELATRTIIAPVDGTVEQMFFDEGEVAQPGMPVLSLLPRDARVIRFFIPEPDRAGFTIGDQLLMECSGCPTGILVELTYIDPQPQFTPPIIYSRDERSRLVYRAEAQPVLPISLFPGQPVTLARAP